MKSISSKQLLIRLWLVVPLIIIMSYNDPVYGTTAKEYFSQGVAAFKNGKYHDALTYFRESVNLDPGKPRTHYNLGVLYKKMGKLEEAIKEFDIAASLNQLPQDGSSSSVNEFVKVTDGVRLKEDKFDVITPDSTAILDSVTPSIQPSPPENKKPEDLAATQKPNISLSSEKTVKQKQSTTGTETTTPPVKTIKQEHDNNIISSPVENAIESLMAEAYGAYLNKSYPQSIDLYKRVLQASPNNAIALKEIGDVYYDSNNYSEALESYLKVYTASSPPAITEKLGDIYTQQGHHREAAKYYQKLLSVDAGNLAIAYKLATTYESQKDYNNAYQVYKQISDIDPFYNNVARSLANLQLQIGSTDEAMASYKQVITQNPLDIEASLTLGQLKMKQGDYAEAIIYLTKVVELNPLSRTAKIDLAEAYYQQGEKFSSLKNTSLAIQSYENTLKYNAKHVNALYSLAQSDILNGNILQAMNKLEIVFSENKNNKEIAYILGNLALKNNDFNKARSYYELVYHQDPTYKDIPEKLLITIHNLGDNESVMKLADSLKPSYKINPTLKYQVAENYYQAGNYQKAASLIQETPTTTEGYAGNDKLALQGLIYYKLGQYDTALIALEKISGTVENQAEVDRTLIDLYEKKEYEDKLIDYLSRMIDKNSNEPIWLEKLAFYSKRKNMNDKALLAYEKLQRLYPQGNYNNQLSDLYLQVGAEEYSKGDYHKAVSCFEKSIGYTISKEGYLYLAKAYSQQNESMKAIDILKMYVDLDQANPEVFYMIATEYKKMKEFDHAVDYLSKVNLIAPDYPNIAQDFINLYSLAALEDLSNKKYAAARDKIEKAVLYDAKNPSLYNNLGYIYHLEGNNLKAAENYYLSLELDSKYIDANYNLARLYLENKDYNKAMKYLKDVLAEDHGNIKANIDLGNIYFRSGQYHIAQDYYGKVIIANPDSYQALYNLGIIEAKKMNYKTSLTYFKQLSNLYPNDMDVKNNLEFLYKKLNA